MVLAQLLPEPLLDILVNGVDRVPLRILAGPHQHDDVAVAEMVDRRRAIILDLAGELFRQIFAFLTQLVQLALDMLGFAYKVAVLKLLGKGKAVPEPAAGVLLDLFKKS